MTPFVWLWQNVEMENRLVVLRNQEGGILQDRDGVAIWEIPCDDGTVVYLGYTSVNISVVILCYSFVRYYHWGKLDKRYIEYLYYFL